MIPMSNKTKYAIKDWEIKTLGEICEVLDSKRKPITKRDRTAGEYPYYGATGILDYVHEYIFDEKLVLIGEDGAKWESGEWTAFIAEGKYWVNNHAHVIRPNRKIVLDNWIVYFLYFSDLHKYVTGLTVPKLNQEKMRSITLPVPPLPEQQRIVSVLDEAFASIAQAKSNAERNLVNARELFESLVERLFENTGKGWKIEKLKRITTKIGSGATPRGGGDSYQAEGLSLIRSLNVHDMGFRMKKLAFLDDEQADKLSNVAVESGDVLLNITGASIARCCIVPDDVLPARVNQHVSIIRLIKDEMIPEFLHYALISKANKDKLLNTGEKGGSTRQALTKAQIEDFSVSYPPLAEQRAIVGRLEALSAETGRLEEIYQSKVEALEELKKSVLGKAFEGGV